MFLIFFFIFFLKRKISPTAKIIIKPGMSTSIKIANVKTNGLIKMNLFLKLGNNQQLTEEIKVSEYYLPKKNIFKHNFRKIKKKKGKSL